RDPRQPGDRDRDDRERDVERKEVDRGCVDVAAPSDRDTDPNEVEREWPRDDAQLTRPLVSLDELPEQTTRSPERDRVERNEKGVSEEADADRDQRKSCKRDEPRLAAKDPSEQRAEHEHSSDRSPELRRVRGRERRGEQGRADAGVAKTGDPAPARARQQQDRESDAGDRACDLRKPDHFGCTLTTAVVGCPFTATTRRYVPGVVGARSRSVLPRRCPCRCPRRQL